jgi:hypothetical protein
LLQWFLHDRQFRHPPQCGPGILRKKETIMATKLNRTALALAEQLIQDGRFVYDNRDAWSEHKPSAEKENEFIRQHGFNEYEKWYLGLEDKEPINTKARYKFPYGDFKNVHRCGLLTAESRAGQYKHYDIENAVAHLHGMLEALNKKSA